MTNKSKKPNNRAGSLKSGGSQRRSKKVSPFATRLSAHVTEEGEWTDPPNLTLSRMFLVVLLLHIVIVGGILAFEMFKDDSVPLPRSASAKPLTADKDALGSQPGRGDTSADVRKYRVRAGDTLSQIAKIHGVTSAKLIAFNGIGSGDQIYPGQNLLIPKGKGTFVGGGIPSPLPGMVDGGGSEIVPASLTRREGPQAHIFTPTPAREIVTPAPSVDTVPRPPTVVTVPPVENARTHKVETGETAYAISRKYGVTVDALLSANGISDARFLRAGNVIRIP